MIPQPDALPLFPLGLVLCPGEGLPLHIFEERYRELVRHCLETEEPFGIVLAEEERVARVGCTARIERVLHRYEDGRLDILVVGEERFVIEEVRQERAYLTARVAPFGGPEGPVERVARERVIALHMKLLDLVEGRPEPSIYEGPRLISFVVAQNAGLDVEQKQALLELERESERLRFLASHLEALIPQVREAQRRQRLARSNGHLAEG